MLEENNENVGKVQYLTNPLNGNSNSELCYYIPFSHTYINHQEGPLPIRSQPNAGGSLGLSNSGFDSRKSSVDGMAPC